MLAWSMLASIGSRAESRSASARIWAQSGSVSNEVGASSPGLLLCGDDDRRDVRDDRWDHRSSSRTATL